MTALKEDYRNRVIEYNRLKDSDPRLKLAPLNKEILLEAELVDVKPKGD